MIIDFLTKYFEKLSLAYHIMFIVFLSYLLFFRKPYQKIPKFIIRCLGLYVITYGTIIFVYGDKVINKSIIIEVLSNIE
jgi:hypothetical protein